MRKRTWPRGSKEVLKASLGAWCIPVVIWDAVLPEMWPGAYSNEEGKDSSASLPQMWARNEAWGSGSAET